MPSKVSILVIGVTDLSRSLAFYEGKLGLQVTNRSANIAMLSADSITLLLSETLGKALKPTAGAMEIVFPVDSVSISQRLLINKGCTFSKNPHEVSPGMWAATFADPDGHLLTVLGGE